MVTMNKRIEETRSIYNVQGVTKIVSSKTQRLPL